MWIFFGGGSSRGVVAKVLDCNIVASEFELQSSYYVHLRTNTLGKDMNLLILLAMGILLSLFKDSFGIRLPTKVDIALKKKDFSVKIQATGLFTFNINSSKSAFWWDCKG